MKKVSSLFCLLLIASVIFSSYSRNDDTNDEGVLIGSIGGTPIRWATRNVAAFGTFTLTPESVGMFFQWNRSQGWTAIGTVTDWNTTPAEGTEWARVNDPCPSGWRVPTREELMALRDAGSEWVNRNGVYGSYFGTAPHRIFLPAAGRRAPKDGVLSKVGDLGAYWSSTQVQGSVWAWMLHFFRGDANVSDGGGFRNGFSVRCVAE